jgi:hypothetical protein
VTIRVIEVVSLTEDDGFEPSEGLTPSAV